MLDELRQDGDPIKFIDIIERNKSWKCRTCEDVYNKEVIFCDVKRLKSRMMSEMCSGCSPETM